MVEKLGIFIRLLDRWFLKLSSDISTPLLRLVYANKIIDRSSETSFP